MVKKIVKAHKRIYSWKRAKRCLTTRSWIGTTSRPWYASVEYKQFLIGHWIRKGHCDRDGSGWKWDHSVITSECRQKQESCPNYKMINCCSILAYMGDYSFITRNRSYYVLLAIHIRIIKISSYRTIPASIERSTHNKSAFFEPP